MAIDQIAVSLRLTLACVFIFAGIAKVSNHSRLQLTAVLTAVKAPVPQLLPLASNVGWVAATC